MNKETNYYSFPIVEIWSHLEEYPGILVSDHGRVMTEKTELIRKVNYSVGGYGRITHFYEGKVSYHYVHRIVGKAFIGNDQQKPQINHKDGQKDNNRIDNLEWVTEKENTAHAYETGLRRKRATNKGKKWKQFTKKEVISIRESLKNGISKSELARKHGVKWETIKSIEMRRTWKNI